MPVFTKFLEKSPLGSAIVRNVALFGPQNMINSSVGQTEKQFRKLLNHDIILKFVTPAFADKALCHLNDFLKNEVKYERYKFVSYDRKLQRLDEFQIGNPINSAKCKELPLIDKCIVTLSHIQTSIKRGFCQNDTKAHNIEITNSMLDPITSARC